MMGFIACIILISVGLQNHSSEPPKTDPAFSAVSSFVGRWHSTIADAGVLVNRSFQEAEAKTFYKQGEKYRSIKLYEEAVAAFLIALNLDPKYEDACYKLGLVYSAMGRWNDAARAFERLVRLNPKDDQAYAKLREIRERLRTEQKTVASTQKTLAQNTTKAPDRVPLENHSKSSANATAPKSKPLIPTPRQDYKEKTNTSLQVSPTSQSTKLSSFPEMTKIAERGKTTGTGKTPVSSESAGKTSSKISQAPAVTTTRFSVTPAKVAFRPTAPLIPPTRQPRSGPELPSKIVPSPGPAITWNAALPSPAPAKANPRSESNLNARLTELLNASNGTPPLPKVNEPTNKSDKTRGSNNTSESVVNNAPDKRVQVDTSAGITESVVSKALDKKHNSDPPAKGSESTKETGTKTPENKPVNDSFESKKPAEIAEREPTQTYRVGIGDVLDVRVNDLHQDQSSTLFTVTAGGLLEYPVLNQPLKVTGLTAEEIGERMKGEIKRLAISEQPEVLVAIREYSSHTVLISGLVKEPGTKILRREAIPLYVVLADAQPFPEAGRAVVIPHETGQLTTIDLSDAKSTSLLVRAGDVITVQANPKQFLYIGGEIKFPGEKSFRPGLTLTQAILAAGGLTRKSKRVDLAREGANGLLEVTRYKLTDINSGKMPDPLVEPGDRITVVD